MSRGLNRELTSFHHFVSEQLQLGRGDMSPEEVLTLWRAQHPIVDAADETVFAVREALEQMENGDQGISLEQFDREFKDRHKLGGDPAKAYLRGTQ